MSDRVNVKNLPVGVIILEPQSVLNKAILRFDEEQNALIYSMELLIDAYMCSEEDTDYWSAKDWICYNIDNVYIEGWPIVE